MLFEKSDQPTTRNDLDWQEHKMFDQWQIDNYLGHTALQLYFSFHLYNYLGRPAGSQCCQLMAGMFLLDNLYLLYFRFDLHRFQDQQADTQMHQLGVGRSPIRMGLEKMLSFRNRRIQCSDNQRSNQLVIECKEQYR